MHKSSDCFVIHSIHCSGYKLASVGEVNSSDNGWWRDGHEAAPRYGRERRCYRCVLLSLEQSIKVNKMISAGRASKTATSDLAFEGRRPKFEGLMPER